jgi:hypothetical protein
MGCGFWLLVAMFSGLKKSFYFYLGRNTSRTMWGGTFIVLFREDIRVISSLGGGNKTSLLGNFKEEKDL